MVLATDREAPAQFGSQLAPAASAIVSQFVTAAMSMQSEQEEDSYEADVVEDDRLVGIACVARVAPGSTCSAVAAALEQQLQIVSSSGCKVTSNSILIQFLLLFLLLFLFLSLSCTVTSA